MLFFAGLLAGSNLFTAVPLKMPAWSHALKVQDNQKSRAIAVNPMVAAWAATLAAARAADEGNTTEALRQAKITINAAAAANKKNCKIGIVF